MPYVFTTSKVKYMHTLVAMMQVETTAPKDIMSKIYSEGGCITNITGRNEFGNIEDDEANEMTGVRETKLGAAQGTFESLSQSFRSAHVLSKAVRRMKSTITSGCDRDDETVGASGAKHRRLLDVCKKETYNIHEMYLISIGEKSKTKLAFLGPDHRAKAVLWNPLSPDKLTLSADETEKMMRQYELGKAAAADLFRRKVPPFRKPGNSQTATKKNDVKGFAGARDSICKLKNEIRAKAAAAAGRSKAMTAATSTMVQMAIDCRDHRRNPLASEEDRRKVSEVEEKLSKDIDIVSEMNYAMRDSDGSDGPRMGKKSDFFRYLSKLLCIPFDYADEGNADSPNKKNR